MSVEVWASGDGWELLQGDAAEYLDDANLSALDVITDPPYTEVPRNTKRRQEHEATDGVKAIVARLVAEARSSIIITGATASTQPILPEPARRVLAIVQNMGTAVPRDAWMYGLQLAHVYGPPREPDGFPSRPVFSLPPRSVARQPRPPDHPNALPISLGAWLAAGLAGRTVLDPFCGGGGLIAGARARGAGYVIGIDLSAEWLEFARQKLEAAPSRLWRRLANEQASESMLL